MKGRQPASPDFRGDSALGGYTIASPDRTGILFRNCYDTTDVVVGTAQNESVMDAIMPDNLAIM